MTQRVIQIEASWLAALQEEFNKPYMTDLRRFLVAEKQNFTVYPPGSLIFNAFAKTPFHEVKVVILGQDPYHGPKQAHGLSFSVQKGISIPPSLKNIFAELHSDLGTKVPNHGDLTSWAEQGVLLLNTVLTVRHRTANSHRGKGWEQFTSKVIQCLAEKTEHVVFVLWGKQAGEKAQMIDEKKHLILRSPHPSPYSADHGFFGSKPFSKINNYLQLNGKKPINWQITN